MKKSKYLKQSFAPMSSINVTPFVDVVLVLLIVFMISAPLINVGIEVSLPQTEAGPILEKSEPLVVSYQSDGSLYVQEKKVDLKKLIPTLLMITKKKTHTDLFLRADKDLPYGKIMFLSGLLSKNGFDRVSLVTEPL
tara:strand:+ start:191 stop:601 length:411 start_codon:yes stop_codon:yes gene_type:complete